MNKMLHFFFNHIPCRIQLLKKCNSISYVCRSYVLWMCVCTFWVHWNWPCLLASHVYEITFVPLKSKWLLQQARHAIFYWQILTVCGNCNKNRNFIFQRLWGRWKRQTCTATEKEEMRQTATENEKVIEGERWREQSHSATNILTNTGKTKQCNTYI